jgi:hypothetical protein
MKSIVLILVVISAFLVSTPTSEEQRIMALIDYIESLENAVFIRNGHEYPAAKAAKHLENKRKKAGKRIKTAEDFISYLASKSSTGEPYKIRFEDGTVKNTKDVLRKELNRIEQENR